jgi:hypothetical protein
MSLASHSYVVISALLEHSKEDKPDLTRASSEIVLRVLSLSSCRETVCVLLISEASGMSEKGCLVSFLSSYIFLSKQNDFITPSLELGTSEIEPESAIT